VAKDSGRGSAALAVSMAQRSSVKKASRVKPVGIAGRNSKTIVPGNFSRRVFPHMQPEFRAIGMIGALQWL
jgi:hypothetical protein